MLHIRNWVGRAPVAHSVAYVPTLYSSSFIDGSVTALAVRYSESGHGEGLLS